MNYISPSSQVLVEYACKSCAGKLVRVTDTEMICAFTDEKYAKVFMQYVSNYMLQTEMRSAVNSTLIYVQVTRAN